MFNFIFLNNYLVWWCSVLGVWFSSFVIIDGIDGLELQDINVGVIGQKIGECHEHLLICMCSQYFFSYVCRIVYGTICADE
jgi:hypothetical protein